MADSKKSDPTIKSASKDEPDYPEGTHPARPVSETHHSADRITYKDNPDKPDPSTVAQVAVFPDDWS